MTRLRYEPEEIRRQLVAPRMIRFSDLVAVILVVYLSLVYLLSWLWQVWPVVGVLYIFPVALLMPVVVGAVALRIFQARNTSQPGWGGLRSWMKLLAVSLVLLGFVGYFQVTSYSPAPSRVVSENGQYFEDVQYEGLQPISKADYELARVRYVRFEAWGLLAAAVGFLLLPATAARSHRASEEQRDLVDD